MANFDKSGMTQAGINLMGKAIGGATIQFTKLVLGDGTMTGEILDLQGVVSPKQNVDVTRIERNDNQCTVGGELLTSSVNQGFFWRECGLYAMDPGVGEILYNYAYSSKPDYIAPSDSGMMEEILVAMVATVGTADVNVTIDDSMVFATRKLVDKKPYYYNSVADMQADSTLKEGDMAITLGFYKPKDGGGTTYNIIKSTSQPSAKNIKLANPGLRAELHFSQSKADVKQFGALGDWGLHPLSEKYGSLQLAQEMYPNALSLDEQIDGLAAELACNSTYSVVYFPYGGYKIDRTLPVGTNRKMCGDALRSAQISFMNPNINHALRVTGANWTICDMSISGVTERLFNGIHVNGACNYGTIYNMFLNSFNNAIEYDTDNWIQKVDNIDIRQCNKGVYSYGSHFNNAIFSKVTITFCDVAMLFDSQGRGHVLDGCLIELNQKGIVRKNNGDIEILNTYFERNVEEDILIAWAQQSLDSLKVSGCQFYRSTRSLEGSAAIVVHAKPTANLVIEHCNFSGNLGSSDEVNGDTSIVYTKKFKAVLGSNGTQSITSLSNNYYSSAFEGYSFQRDPWVQTPVASFDLQHGIHGYTYTPTTKSFIDTNVIVDGKIDIYRISCTTKDLSITLPNMAEFEKTSPNLVFRFFKSDDTEFVVRLEGGDIKGKNTFTSADKNKMFTVVLNRVSNGRGEFFVVE